jgi:hypothetical protein
MRMRRLVIVTVALMGCNGALPLTDDASTDGAATDATADDATMDAADGGAADVVDAGCPYCSDPLNCGSSGHDCLGGACVDAMCQPTTLVTDASAITLALNDTTVFWVASYGLSSIQSCAKAGCQGAPTQIVGTGFSINASLVADNTDVYWSDNSTIRDTPLGSGTTTLASGQPYPNFIAADSTTVYWTDSCVNCAIRACAKIGCNNNPQTLVSNISGAGSLVVDATNAYWLVSDQIQTTPLVPDGGAPTTIFDGQGYVGVQFLTSDATHLFWSGSLDYSVHQCDKTNCAATDVKLATDANAPGAVYVDATDAYWTTPASGLVRKCKIGGCNKTPITLADNQNFPSSIVGDSTALFWVAPMLGGGLYRLAK